MTKGKGRNQVFSGKNDNTKWLLLDDISKILSVIFYYEQKRNRPRAIIYMACPSFFATFKLN